MNPASKFFLVGTAFVLSVGALAGAQTGVQANGQAGAQATVQADKTQAQASGGASTSASASGQSASGQSASGQTASGQPSQANAGLASGTAFNATLNAPIDSNKCKPGDAVTARTTENVKADGKTVLPKGSKLVGHVTQATARAKGDSESALAITFDRAILKNGQEMPLNVAIQAMAGAQTAASAADADMDAMGSTGASGAGSGRSGGRSAGGGLTSTAGSAVGAVTNTAAGAGDAALHSTVSSTTGVASASRGAVGGLSTAGQLMSNSRGVFNMNGLNLNAAAANGTQGAVITSAGKNVHLDSGTRLLLVTEATASATPNR
jgi:hypothetical protein